MDLTEAIAAHTRWKIRLLQCIRGQADLPNAAETARGDACELGKWLAGAGMEHAALDSFQETRAMHTVFHLRAAEVVKAVESGDSSQAEAMLGPESRYGVASEAVILALTKLRGEVRKEGRVSLPS